MSQTHLRRTRESRACARARTPSAVEPPARHQAPRDRTAFTPLGPCQPGLTRRHYAPVEKSVSRPRMQPAIYKTSVYVNGTITTEIR